MRVAIYVRTSDVKDRDTGQKQQDYLNELREVAGAQGWEVVAEISEAISGAAKNRRIEKAVRLVEAGDADFILVWDVSRFGRDKKQDAEMIDRLHAAAGFATDRLAKRSDRDELAWDMEALFGHHQRKAIKAGAERGRKARAAEGKWLGGLPPFGTRVEDHFLVEDPDAAKAIKDAYRIVVQEGGTTGDVAKAWNGAGVLTPRKTTLTDEVDENGNRKRRSLTDEEREWKYRNVGRVLRDKRLTGKLRWRDYDIDHPVLLTKRQHADLIRALKRKGHGPRPQETWQKYPLSGRIQCPCGGVFVGIGEHGPSPEDGSRPDVKKIRYYGCNRGKDCTGPVKYQNAPKAEAAAADQWPDGQDWIAEWAFRWIIGESAWKALPKVEWEPGGPIPFDAWLDAYESWQPPAPDPEPLRAELAKVDDRIADLLIEDLSASPEATKKALTKLNKRYEDLSAELDRVERELVDREQRGGLAERISEAVVSIPLDADPHTTFPWVMYDLKDRDELTIDFGEPTLADLQAVFGS